MELITETDATPYIYKPELEYPLQHVFRHLFIKDLYTLSLVSRKCYNEIERYCESRYKQLSLETELNKLLENELLINGEKSLPEELRENKYNYKRLFATYMKWMGMYRRSVTKVHENGNGSFTWFPDNRYIVKEYDEQIDRDIVRLKTVCWLDMGYNFRNVKPGKYIATWRMDITDGVWPENNITSIWVSWEDSDGENMKKIEVTPSQFEQLRRNLNRLGKRNPIPLGSAYVMNYDTDGWFDLSFGEVILKSVCTVYFGFRNLGSWWKEGMRWDYLELKQINY